MSMEEHYFDKMLDEYQEEEQQPEEYESYEDCVDAFGEFHFKGRGEQ